MAKLLLKQREKNSMKKILLSLAVLSMSVACFSQNVQDQQVSFQYTQLPSTPFSDKISTYNLEVNTDAITKANDDSMDVYNTKLVQWETNFEQWLLEKQKIDKAFLLEMANYEKAVNGGNAAAPVPVKAPYPEQPIKEEIPLPILTEEVPNEIINSTVSIDGYVVGENGAKVTLEVLGFQEAKIIMKKTGTGATTKYEYSTTSKFPIHVTVSTPDQGVLLDEVVGNTLSTKKLKDYASKYEYEYWAIDNLEDYWKQTQKNLFANNLRAINTMINEKFGFVVKQRGTEIFTVKKHKGHDYSDLIDAYSNANSGYALIIKDLDRDAAEDKIRKAISIWENALTESNINDSKSRVNKKVTALISMNLAEAYMWINEFQNAETYRIKAEQGGVSKYKNEAQRLEPVLNALKARYQANQ